MPDDITIEVVRLWLDEHARDSGFIFDGFPRTRAQAEAFDRVLYERGIPVTVAILLDAQEADIIDRVLGRLSCEKCGALYHKDFVPPRVPGVCDKCGGPIAGKYRLIDIPVSNCINSGLNRIFVLTQFNSVSLHRHIYNTYKFDPYGGGFVEILAAQQTMEHESWYQGTADAVRRNIPYFTESTYDLVLILSGDQLYRMDFQDMIRTHQENKAAVTIAALAGGRTGGHFLRDHEDPGGWPGRQLRGEAQDD